MKRSKLNYLVDAAAFVAFVFLVATGVVIRYTLPSGSGHFATVWGMDRHGWGNLHFWIAVTLLVAFVIHLFLHWRWIVSMTKGRRSDLSVVRIGIGVVGSVGLVGLALAPFFSPVVRTGEPPHRSRRLAGEHVESVASTDDHEHTSGTAASNAPDRSSQQEILTPSSEHSGAEVIRGSMSLRDVEELTQVPVEHILAELNLSGRIDPDHRIGRLRRTYGISPDDVRRVVVEYQRRSE